MESIIEDQKKRCMEGDRGAKIMDFTRDNLWRIFGRNDWDALRKLVDDCKSGNKDVNHSMVNYNYISGGVLPPFDLLKDLMYFGNRRIKPEYFEVALDFFYHRDAAYCVLEDLFKLFKLHGCDFNKCHYVFVLMYQGNANKAEYEMAMSYGVDCRTIPMHIQDPISRILGYSEPADVCVVVKLASYLDSTTVNLFHHGESFSECQRRSNDAFNHFQGQHGAMYVATCHVLCKPGDNWDTLVREAKRLQKVAPPGFPVKDCEVQLLNRIEFKRLTVKLFG